MKRFFKVLLCFGILVPIHGCQTVKQPSDKDSVSTQYVDDVFKNTAKYKGKFLRLTGQVYRVKKNTIYVHHDIKNNTQNFTVQSKKPVSVHAYIKASGKLTKKQCVDLSDATIKTGSYTDIIVPGIQTITCRNKQNIDGITLRVHQIEWAQDETRIQLRLDNQTDQTFYLNSQHIQLRINGKKISQYTSSSSMIRADLPRLSDQIGPKTSTQGTIIFPSLHPKLKKGVTIQADGIRMQPYGTIYFSIHMKKGC